MKIEYAYGPQGTTAAEALLAATRRRSIARARVVAVKQELQRAWAELSNAQCAVAQAEEAEQKELPL